MRALAVFVTLATLSIALALGFSDQAEAKRAKPGGAPQPGSGSLDYVGFVRVLQGDAVEIGLGGNRVAVRLIGLRTPSGNTPCGHVAADYLQGLVFEGMLFDEDESLTYDRGGLRMYYGRLPDGRSVASLLVSAGLARANGLGREATALAAAQAEARKAKRGCLWGGLETAAAAVDSAPEGVATQRSLAVAGTLPAGFTQDIVAAGLSNPTAFAFLPDGRILIAQKSGIVRIWKNGTVLSTPFLDIRSQVNDYTDRGLIGLAVDPNFSSNGHVYVLYVYEHNATDYTGPKSGRLARYTASGDTASPASESVVLGSLVGPGCDSYPADADCIPEEWIGHSVGNVKFASDGSMFVTIGDASNWNTVNDPALRAQDIDSLAGKVLRISPTGAGLPSNPFWNGNPDAHRSKVWAYGVRNAFRFNIRPSNGTLYVGDVGWNTTEEVSVVPAGANLGWPCYEGALQQSGYAGKAVCQSLYLQGPSAVQAPLTEYAHGGQGAAVVGGAFYTGTAYPAAYQGAYFYGDYAQGSIKYLTVSGSDTLTGGPTTFGSGLEAPVDIELGPDGNLYYLSITTGELRRITYTGGAQGGTRYLSDLTWASATNGWGPVEKDKSNADSAAGDGRTITLNAATYGKGLGTHAASTIIYPLDGTCTQLLSDVGVDDEVGTNGSVSFQVLLDGASVYTSGTMTGATATKTVDVAIPPTATQLTLVVGNGGDTISYDHADWAGARLVCGSGGGGTQSLFGQPSYLAAGTQPHSVKAGDLNGDGKRDLVIDNSASNSLSVYLGNGDGTFALASTPGVGAGTDPKAVSIADLNADGKPDLVTANQNSNTASVLLGNGDGTFGAAVQYAICTSGHDVAVGDLNQDGKLDLALACWGGSVVSVLLGNGDGSFQARVNYQSGSAPHGLVITDVNADGKLDLAVANGSGTDVGLLLGNGDGTFQTRVLLAVGPQPHAVQAGDVNSDGKVDLVTANSGGNTVSVLLGNGNGTFQSASSFLVGSSPVSVAIADLDGDGRKDLVASNIAGTYQGGPTLPGGDNVSVLLGSGNGSFGTQTVYVVGSTPFSVIAADLNQDGKVDLATSNWWGSNASVLLNGGSGGGGSDTTPPTVSSITPATGATGVATTSVVQATFSEAIDPASLGTATFTLTKQGAGQPIAAQLAYDSTTRTATLTPSANLETSATYTAVVKGGSAGVKDLVGNALAADRIWSFTTTITGGSTVYLSDIAWTSATNGWGPVERDRSNADSGAADGGTITLNGVTSAKGLGTHALSTIIYPLDGTCGQFLADVGVDDEVGANGSVSFQVLLDGASVYTSGTMTGSTATKTVDVAIPPTATQLRLVVGNGGDNINYDHADWAGARLVCGGNRPPVPSITKPLSTPKVKVGDTVTYEGSATDPEDGPIPDNNLSWQIILSHCPGGTCHEHLFLSGTGKGGTFTAPDHGDDTHFEFVLTATDSDGATAVTTVQLQPETTLLTLTTVPAGLQVVYGGTTYTTPVTVTAQVGGTRTILGPSPQGASTFVSWSDSGLQQHDVVIGSIATTYTATYSGTAPTPTVTSTTPTAGATGASVLTAPSATFSVAMNASTITASTFTLTKQGTTTPVAATVSYDAATQKATLTPASALAPGTQYTAKVVGGPSGAKSSLGGALSQDVTWTFTTSTSTTAYLSDLTWTSATNGWGPVEKDKSNGDSPAGDGKTITLNGTTFAKGLGAHAASDIRYPLARKCSSFQASVGVDDEVGTRGSVVFQVWLDGAKLYDSAGMTGSTATKTVSVDVTNKIELRLVITNGGDNVNYDHADWASARITCAT